MQYFSASEVTQATHKSNNFYPTIKKTVKLVVHEPSKHTALSELPGQSFNERMDL